MMFQGRGKLCQMTDGPSLTGEAGAIDPSLEGMTLNCQAAGGDGFALVSACSRLLCPTMSDGKYLRALEFKRWYCHDIRD